jgi:hypothetical protein
MGQLGKHDEARTWYDEAVVCLEDHAEVAADDEVKRFLREAQELLGVQPTHKEPADPEHTETTAEKVQESNQPEEADAARKELEEHKASTKREKSADR